MGLQEKGAPRLGQVDMSDLFAANDGPVGPRDDASLSSTGGHNLRARDAMGRTLRGGRPQSLFSPQGKGAPGAEVRRVLNLENIQDTYDDDGDDYEEDDDDEAVDNRSTHEYAQDHGTFENNQATTSNTNDVINNNNINNNNILPLPLPQPGVTFQTFPPPTTLPAQTQRAPRPSALAASASLLEQRAGYSLRSSLEWQSSVQGDTARIKNFQTEVLQSRDLITFAYMRPGSAYIQFLHSASTFSLHGGTRSYENLTSRLLGIGLAFDNPLRFCWAPTNRGNGTQNARSWMWGGWNISTPIQIIRENFGSQLIRQRSKMLASHASWPCPHHSCGSVRIQNGPLLSYINLSQVMQWIMAGTPFVSSVASFWTGALWRPTAIHLPQPASSTYPCGQHRPTTTFSTNGFSYNSTIRSANQGQIPHSQL